MNNLNKVNEIQKCACWGDETCKVCEPKDDAYFEKGKGKAIKEEIHHKVKAGDRRKQVNKQIDDNLLIRTLQKELYMACSDHWQGEYSKEKARNKKYKRMFWTAVGIIIAIPIIYVVIIAIIN